jgi:hypothetical protein
MKNDDLTREVEDLERMSRFYHRPAVVAMGRVG